MSKAAYFLLKTSIREDYAMHDAARDIEQMAEAVCVDYVWLDEDLQDNSPYIAY
tara:strand:- start:1721 stop:1882 length:162 start_codon:yes stop_codon:yes gene_type:complete